MNSEWANGPGALHLKTPLDTNKVKKLHSGDMIYLSGTIYGARDAAHKRMLKAIRDGQSLPVGLADITIFYVGPSPTPPGKRSGSIGPTTAARMDAVTEPLLARGVRAMIGKGKRSETLKKMCPEYGSVYLISIGGIAAYLSSKVSRIEAIAYEDLGPEAIYRIEINDFPLFVAYDIYGGDIFEYSIDN
ncbi:MAG: FumA C-terminus/TtdB family hydratase beta subunit [Actinomycetia bacterium]|nr:FumA C-terminus/TtdB family hydratase beta subunit [Actinomycetes bacterium]